MSRKNVGALSLGATFLRTVNGTGGRRWWRRVKVLAVTALSSGFVRVRAVVLKTGEVTDWVVSTRRKVLALTSATIPSFI